MSVYEDEHAAEDLQHPEVWMASDWSGSKDSKRCCETYRENAGT